MPRNILRLVRDTAVKIASYAGPTGELVYNKDSGDVHVQDGATQGGTIVVSLKTLLLAGFLGAAPINLTTALFAQVHARHFGVVAIPADAPAEQRVSQTQKLRAAIAFCGVRGAHLRLDYGDTWFGASPDDTEACLRIQRTMGLSGEGFGSRLMPLPDVVGRHLLMLKPLAGVPMQGAFLRNFAVCEVGGGHAGLNSLRIDTTNAGGYIAGLVVDHVSFGPGGPTNRAVEHFNTDAANKNGGVFGSTFYDCTVVGGMKFTKTGDSNNIIQCRISNFGVGIDYDCTSGAAMHRFEGNNITSQGGGIVLRNCLQAHVLRNQIEQSFAYTGDAADNASVMLIGSTQCVIGGNNINTHGRVDAIAFRGSPYNTIQPNTLCYGDTNFAVRATNSVGLRFDVQVRDIIFDGQDNQGTSREFSLTSIDAASEPVMGLPMALPLANGYTDAGGANFNNGVRATLLPNKTVRLSGNLANGTRAQGTRITTVPVSMRPRRAQYIPVDINMGVRGYIRAMLLVDTVGQLTVVRMLDPADNTTLMTGGFGLDTVAYHMV